MESLGKFMAKLKISELFNSIQGEGRYAGVPSVFLRTFGCNFRCPGFGRDHSEASTPNQEVIEVIKQIPEFQLNNTPFERLPLVETGCDTYAAVYPEFKSFSPMLTTTEIVNRIKTLIPNGFHQNQHLVVTGGEPLLPGWQKAYDSLFSEILENESFVERGILNVTFETNGTQKLTDDFLKTGKDNRLEIHFSISPKLSASGEPRSEAINLEVLESYTNFYPEYMDFKFVVATLEHVEEVNRLFDKGGELYKLRYIPVYLMPVGGLNELYSLNKRTVADLAIKYGYRFSPRLQNDLYGNEWST